MMNRSQTAVAFAGNEISARETVPRPHIYSTRLRREQERGRAVMAWATVVLDISRRDGLPQWPSHQNGRARNEGHRAIRTASQSGYLRSGPVPQKFSAVADRRQTNPNHAA